MPDKIGGKPQDPQPSGADPEETASYIIDMCRVMAQMAKAQDFELLTYLLNMAALEAAEIRVRVGARPSARPPARQPAPGGAS